MPGDNLLPSTGRGCPDIRKIEEVSIASEGRKEVAQSREGAGLRAKRSRKTYPRTSEV